MRKIQSQRLDFSRLFSHALAPHLVWAVGLNLLLWAAQVSAGQVTLRWDAVNGASGYRVYYGQTSGSYTSQVNVVGQTQTTSPPVSITNGLIYFFAVKAYNSTGQESPFSNEVRVAPPVAAFNASATSGTAPLSVTFTDQSTGTITERSWNFGDGTSSTVTPVSHTYNTPGPYTVTLTVKGAGQTATATKTITVTAPSVPGGGGGGGSTPPPGQAITIEAEDMMLTRYSIETSSAASGGRLISRLGAGTAPGEATAVFAGLPDEYKITVQYFDENDGVSSLSVMVQRVLATWVADAALSSHLPSNATRRSRVVADKFSLAPGDIITLEGSEQASEYARFDKIDFVPVSGVTPGQVITIEAEDMTLTRYSIETLSAASGGQLISRLGAGTAPGEATAVFAGLPDEYKITVQYFDENDGVSSLSVMWQRVLDTWVANAASSGSVPSSATRRSRVVADKFSLAPGDIITLEGSEQAGEYARFDKIDFVPVQ